ncbi:MAG: AAA family ATPase [Acidobacteria bacterium]|nr:AAA family ATPase [Acidobacteriota bacterium]
MIESVEFKNYKALQDTKLPLSPFTLIIGPNGSGKTTALKAIELAAKTASMKYSRVVSFGHEKDTEGVKVKINWSKTSQIEVVWKDDSQPSAFFLSDNDFPESISEKIKKQFYEKELSKLSQMQIYSFDATAIARPVNLSPIMYLQENGSQLAGVLDQLRDKEPEKFELLNQEVNRLLPEYDRILFDTPDTGQRSFLLRTTRGKHKVQAEDLSTGTLFALAILTLAYIPDHPPLICIEEPDHGIHPRLLRDLQDALYRLSYPESVGEKRDPIQIICTTHSPYFLDLFRDHPEEVVIASKKDGFVTFERLSERFDIEDILQESPLSDVWYSGVLGGVPIK